MQLSTEPINKNLERQLSEMLYGVLAEVDSPLTIKMLLEDILTSSERITLIKRLGIALYLDKGRNYDDIKNNIKVSSATIATVASGIGGAGWQEIIRRIKAEEWATNWSKKISTGLRKFF